MPFFQTLAWILFAIVLLFLVRVDGESLYCVLFQRVRSGAPISAGPLSIGSPPKEILKGEHTGVTDEGTEGSPTPSSVEKSLNEGKYPENIVDDLFLVHEAQVIRERSAQRAGLFRIRVTLEALESKILEDVENVTYKLHQTFPQPIITTRAKDKQFELWVNVYGEFCIIAVVARKGKQPVWLSRYLNLPGRPSD